MIDDARYGWNPLLEDQVNWCVWSAPNDLHVASLLSQLALVLMQWDMIREAKAALQKALTIKLQIKGSFSLDTINTMLLLGQAAWKAGCFEEGLILLETAGECFAMCGEGQVLVLAVQCFLKVAAGYDALGWPRRAECVWDKVVSCI